MPAGVKAFSHFCKAEAMVRVALEIAVDGTYKKVLWWPDFWSSSQMFSRCNSLNFG